MGGDRIRFANTLRGIAACCVLVSHHLGVFWSAPDAVAGLIKAPAADVTMPSYLEWLHTMVPAFNWGAFGVALFFLISGFVIPFSLKRASAVSFLTGRLFRILPVYAVGFSISLIAIWLVGKYFDVPWPFSIVDILIHYLPGLRDIAWSPGIDGIIWTLEIEVKFYVICALAITLFRTSSIWVFSVPVLLALAAYVVTSNLAAIATDPFWYPRALALISVTPYLVFMFTGVAFHYVHVKTLEAQSAIGVVFALSGIALGLWAAGPYAASLPVAWNYAFAVVVFAIAASAPRVFEGNRVTEFLANISYPLYVVHGVAGYAALRLLWAAGVPAWASLLIVTPSTIAIAWSMHLIVEAPTHQYGRKLAERMRSEHTPETAS